MTTATGTISNTSSVTGIETDPNGGNNSANELTTVNPASSDLFITKTDSPDPVAVFNNLTYTVTVTNNGPSIANAVTVTDTLPGGVNYVSSNTSQGSCSEAGGTVTCNLGSLASGANVTVTIVVTPTATGTITNTVSVTGNESDTNLANNSATETTTVGIAQLTNISTRAFVGTGANVEIGGFIIEGTEPKTVLIRGRGPSMSGEPFNISGTLSNPFVRVYSFASGTYIAQNDNWQTSDPLCGTSGYVCGGEAEIIATGLDPCIPNPGQSTAPPGCTNESAVLITLPPGQYGAIVSGVSNGTGVGLVEVFDVDSGLSILENISTRAFVGTGAKYALK